MSAWVTQYLGILILLGGGLLNVVAGLQDPDRKRTKLLLGGMACVFAFASGMPRGRSARLPLSNRQGTLHPLTRRG